MTIQLNRFEETVLSEAKAIVAARQKLHPQAVARRLDMRYQRVLDAFRSLEAKGHIRRTGQYKRTVWTVVEGKRHSGISDVEEYIRRHGVTRCPPAAALGALHFNAFQSGLGGLRGRSSGGN